MKEVLSVKIDTKIKKQFNEIIKKYGLNKAVVLQALILEFIQAEKEI